MMFGMENRILSWTRTHALRTRNAVAGLLAGCVHCNAAGTASDISPRLCSQCADTLTGLEARRCERCAVILTSDNSLCLPCLQSPPTLRSVSAFADYNEALQHLILNYKFHGMLRAAPLLADVLQLALRDYALRLRPDIIVPVPQFEAHTLQRGFVPLVHLLKQTDGARLWAEPPELSFDALIRLHHARLQVDSTPESRHKQVKGAFAATHDFTGQNVLLIDDVYTTGATLNELAKVCLAAGAKSVDALVLARGRRVK